MKRFQIILLLSGCVFSAWAEDGPDLDRMQPDTTLAAIERGADDVMNNCHNCHSLKYVKYRELVAFGIPRSKVDGWRGDEPLDSPLTGLMSDETAMQSFGKIPPDLSLMAQARDGGPSYVYSYLLAYYIKPDGMIGNHVFPVTKMPDVLDVTNTTDPKQRKALRTQAHDIVSFLAWAADPHAAERRRLGYYVIGYLVVLTLLLYFLKRQIWSRIK